MLTGSPAVHLARKRPPSTAGRTASMTARVRPSVMIFPAQPEGGEWREVEVHCVQAAMGCHGCGFDAAQISPAGAPILARIAVENLAPSTTVWNTEQKVAARDRREVGDDQQRGCSGALAHEGGDAHRCIVG